MGLLEDVAYGNTHITVACKHARDQMRDNPNVVGSLAAIASLGSSGKHPANQERDLHRWCKALFGVVAQPYNLWIDLQTDDQDCPFPHAIPCLPPSEMFNAIWTAGCQGRA